MEIKKDKIIFQCDCGSEGLVVSSFQWDDDTPVEIDIAFWKHGHDVPYTLKEKIKAIFYILRKGHPYTDMVCLDTEKAKNLANAILYACDHPEK